MLKRKLLFLAGTAFALCFSGFAFAKGVDATSAIRGLPLFTPNMYIQANVGYTTTDWVDFANHLTSNPTFSKNGRGGFVVGGAIGYTCMSDFALELGGYYLPSATYDSTSTFKISSWVGNITAKLSVPIADDLGLYGQAGVGYRSVDNHFSADKKGGYWGPVFGVGGQYQLPYHMYVAVQYMRIPSHSDSEKIQNEAAAADIYTLNLGYQFDV